MKCKLMGLFYAAYIFNLNTQATEEKLLAIKKDPYKKRSNSSGFTGKPIYKKRKG